MNGKCASILIHLSNHKKLYFHGTEINPTILLLFSTAIRKKSSYQKHLGMFLNNKLDFDKRRKGASILQIYKYFVRP